MVAGAGSVVAAIALYFVPAITLDIYALGCLAVFAVVAGVGFAQSLKYMRSMANSQGLDSHGRTSILDAGITLIRSFRVCRRARLELWESPGTLNGHCEACARRRLVFTGTAFGARGESDGEVVFNTSMTGYQEILTDPSYHGQIVTMTYPQIGNYGVNDEDAESARPWVRGFVVRELSGRVEQLPRDRLARRLIWRNTASSASRGSTPGCWSGRLASSGAMKGILSTIDRDDASLVAKAKASPGLVGRDLAREVMPRESYTWEPGLDHSLLDGPD